MNKLEKLFLPAKIGSLDLPNRIIMVAVTTRYDFDENNRLFDFYAARAKGGVGLIITGALQTLYPGRKIGASRINIYSDEDIPKLKKWVRAIHDNGGKAAAQLATYGYWSKKGPEGTAESVGPSSVVLPRENIHPLFSLAEYLPPERALTLEEIMMIQEAIGAAALRAQEAGFDALELQCIGGNILHRFTNPFLNRRDDSYGGSAENRLRMITESIANIRKKVGKDFPIICRIAGADPVPWGLKPEDWLEFSSLLEKAGVDALNVYPKWFESREPLPQMCVPRNPFVYLAEGIKQVVNIPVITGVRINDPLDAAQILDDGKADFIGLGRPLIADPDLPNKAKEGRLEDIRLCTACCRCYDDVAAEKFMTCAVNAQAGREREYTVNRAETSKKVFVIGGGPAGMEAARVAALRGHQVTLFEATDKLGGQLIISNILPHKEEWNSTVQYLSTQLAKLRVEVRMNELCTAEKIEEGRPEVVIVATGSTPRIPDLPGINGNNVVTAIDVLIGRKHAGQIVVIVGGGSTGCETGEFLAQLGKQVTILEMQGRMGADYGPMNRWVVIDRLIDAGIRLECGMKVESITEKGVSGIRAGLYPEFFEADTVVLSLGMISDDVVARDMEGKVPTIFKIGDAVKPAGVGEAIESGFKIGSQI
ncbi:MAG TPA: FAD-dependent oxidoreductase [Deltaproteobacteria bacterium]|nr:FAD-dependent oxidoreductase [Deltaproteobacteria bacterium]